MDPERAGDRLLGQDRLGLLDQVTRTADRLGVDLGTDGRVDEAGGKARGQRRTVRQHDDRTRAAESVGVGSLRGGEEGLVHRVGEGVACRDERREARQEHGESRGEDRSGDDATAKGHAVRRAYPTPRTV